MSRLKARRLPSSIVTPGEVKAFIEKHGISAYQLGLLCGDTDGKGKVSDWISGRRNPGVWLRPYLLTLDYCLKHAPKKFFEGE